MSEMPLALLVSGWANWKSGLKSMLEHRGIAVFDAPSCAEAALLLHGYTPPHIVFTDMQLEDGSWTGILSLAETSSMPVNVIVVSRNADIDTYVQALERGAFDFIVPPLETSEIDHVIRNAMASVCHRREMERAKFAVAKGLRKAPEDETEPSPCDDDLQMAPLA